MPDPLGNSSCPAQKALTMQIGCSTVSTCKKYSTVNAQHEKQKITEAMTCNPETNMPGNSQAPIK
jgi:hypothetical protein